MTEFNEREYQAVIFGALLHDIGKFYQRAGFKLEAEDEYWITVCCKKFHTSYGERYSHQHAVYSGKFIRRYLKGFDEVEVLAMHHHMPDNAPKKYLAKLITLADWLASGERRDREEDEELGDPSKEPLISIFSRIKIDDKGVEEHYVPISTLNAALDGMFPVKSREATISQDPQKTNSYRFLWEQFKNEIEKIDATDLLNQIFYLIEKYTLCIPAATYKDKPDLSLYHHSKSVATIAACLYHLRLPEEKIDQILNEIRIERYNSDLMKETYFLFIGGDISGIQDFIYSVTSAKALKGLRGRSFYLQLLSETIAKMILSDFNLPETNLLYCGGGHFYLLLPLIKDAEDKLNGIRKRVDKILLTAHRGKLSTIIGLQPISWQDIISFGDVWNQIGGILAKKKKQKLSEFLKDPKDSFEILGPYEKGGETKACEICGDEIEKGEQCPLCESFSSLSSKLAKAETIKITRVGETSLDKMPSRWTEVLEALGYSYSFPEREDKNALCINSTDFIAKYAGYKFIAHNTPMKGKEVMTLEVIAEEATGIKKWGVLRVDVDNLGRIFKEGLGEDKTISRVSMLSYMLSLFFSARVDKIAEEFKNKVYVVYSGGDDLFILGTWSELPQIARRIYEDFRSFTCNNLTLSGGIYLAPSQKFPVYQAAGEGGRAVDNAKEDQKNKLTFLDKPISWQDLESISDVAETIRKLLEDYEKRSVPRSLLSTLYAGWQEKELMEKKEISMVRIWRLFYAFKKLMRGYKEKEAQLIELNELFKRVVTDINLMPYLDIAVRWADYLTRKEA
jgi:CRISPR-associated protein Csm1